MDCSCFYRVTGEAFPGGQTVTGLCIFDKRVMLFGSVGSVKVYSSDGTAGGDDKPVAVVSAVDPICLHCAIVDGEVNTGMQPEHRDIPESIRDCFDEPLVLTDTSRRWLTTIGQFSIIRLERDTQLVVPAYDYCMPEKECPGTVSDDPCTLFSRIQFPVDEFFPPDSVSASDDYRSLK